LPLTQPPGKAFDQAQLPLGNAINPHDWTEPAPHFTQAAGGKPPPGGLGDALIKALQATKSKLTGNPVAEDDLPPINTAPWRNPNLPGA
jgi:hypothetical protein